MHPDGTTFFDHKVHEALVRMGIKRIKGTEWFRCTVEDVRAAWIAVKHQIKNIENRTNDFKMRPEQEAAVNKTIQYYRSESKSQSFKASKFLWNAKMRFGKTFATYQLAKRMDLSKILILTLSKLEIICV
jgi:hypothetical protein